MTGVRARLLGPLAVAAAVLLPAAASAGTAAAAEPALTVGPAALSAALRCTDGIDDATRTPIMLVTGTGATGDAIYALTKGAFDELGAPVCYVNFPRATTGDIQVSVQYLVAGLRTMTRRAGRKVAIVGISQGGLLPRIALTYWPSLRTKVTDVVAEAGTQHGTTQERFTSCARLAAGCIPAGWQQAAGSQLLRALARQPDETPGPTAWTTVRTATDEVVLPQTGPHPTSALRGASNVLIQAVCPGRRVTHVGTAVDSVTVALIRDAVTHPGPASVRRLPDDVCARRYGDGLEPAAVESLLEAGTSLTAAAERQPKVKREPPVRAAFRER